MTLAWWLTAERLHADERIARELTGRTVEALTVPPLTYDGHIEAARRELEAAHAYASDRRDETLGSEYDDDIGRVWQRRARLVEKTLDALAVQP